MTQSFDTEDLCGRLDEDRGYNMNTCSGLPVWPADPRLEDIRIEDIAGALSRICRYNGHLKNSLWVRKDKLARALGTCYVTNGHDKIRHIIEIYSVAQHSVLVEEKVARGLARDIAGDILVADELRNLRLAALLHDAPEYVLGDFVKPQKRMYAELPEYNAAWERAIAERFGFEPALFNHPAIKEADYRMFLTEKRDLVNCVGTDFGEADAEPYSEQIVPVLPSAARAMFMRRFNELYRGD